MNSEKGSLQDTRPIKLFIRICAKNLTGTLLLKNESNVITIYFNRGSFTWALASGPEYSLEKQLLKLGFISGQILDQLSLDTQEDAQKGKFMVEKGLITLEELIQASKAQITAIISAGLEMHGGTFQFISEALPQRLLSLDLNVAEFIHQHIMSGLDMGEVWKSIGSLQSEFQRLEDSRLEQIFVFNQEIRDVLLCFEREPTLEKVVLHFSERDKFSIVKTVYYLLSCELLQKKEFELASPEEFNAMPFNLEDNLAPGTETQVDSSYSLGDAELEDMEEIGEPNAQPVQETPFSPKVKRPFSLLWVMLVLIAALSIAIFLLFKGSDDQSTLPVRIISETKTEQPSRPPEKKVPPEADVVEEVSDPLVARKTEPAPVTPLSENREQLKDQAMDQFVKGNWLAAADIWKHHLAASGFSHSILLEFVCQKTSVNKAFAEIQEKNNFFLLARPRESQDCFYILYGLYASAEEAGQAILRVPRYFREQQHPPRVIELKSYL